MSRQTFINLPVKDLAKATEFFTVLGFSFDPEPSDENTIGMMISDDTFVMLHTEPYFRQFAQQDATDTTTSREVVLGVSADSREQVDDLVRRAVDAGGQALGDPVDWGFMYMQAFRDLDGHQWSFLHMEVPAGSGQ